LGVYRGLRFGMVLHPQFVPEVYLDGAIAQQTMLSREHHGPRALLNAVERLASGYDSECDRVRQDLTIAEAQLRDYQARLGAPFSHEAHLVQLTALRDQLKAGLSGAQPEPGAEPPPTVSELAERIKTLKANHAIEYITEYDPKERIAFGLACGHEDELGYFSIDEMEKARGPLGLAVERDLHWKPKPLSQVQRSWQQDIADDRGSAGPERGR
jgi:hypothetical protein